MSVMFFKARWAIGEAKIALVTYLICQFQRRVNIYSGILFRGLGPSLKFKFQMLKNQNVGFEKLQSLIFSQNIDVSIALFAQTKADN